ncbi:hypothetical protein C1645_840981 [Glomus cerebriforme]|uniref:Myb/SANT-like domain-containing protein n=1 Tax=Glomus cerebriforme TaxID=658196 RepID=A0A397SAF6_9GLOM|nr:hypothetical protein C1645_840981 [Glomus cerebriforme]
MEFSDIQLHILIDEHKNRNAEYYVTINKKKYLFWNKIAKKINNQENTNYFTGEAYHKKFLNLTKAFYMAEKYKKGTGAKRSLVGEEIYEKFSLKFWLKPDMQPPFGRTCSESVQKSSRKSLTSHSSNTKSERTTDIEDLFETSPPALRPVTPSMEQQMGEKNRIFFNVE